MNWKRTDSNCVALSDSDYQILTINEKELLILIVTTIQDLKRNKKKCDREEVYNLLKVSVVFHIS